jgi:hypothetical protein
MASTPEREIKNPARRVEPSGSGRGRRWCRRHDDAVIQAEVRRLARVLRPYGVLHRTALEDAAGARRWHEGGFDSGLSAAVDSGATERLPAGLFCSPKVDGDG